MPRLAQVRITRLQVPLKAPYRLSFRPVEHFDTLVVECEAGDGATGLGEATVLTGYTEETIEGSWRAAGDIAGRLKGLDTREAKALLVSRTKKLPFTVTAFATALEMLEGNAYLSPGREQAVRLLAGINEKEDD